ncbi:hypothetical protein Q1W73_02365 [Asticcacaulis sp. ZE23SCel15]|uniref:hypothetical protein n=1 Tax=Asticcacaulis sp. ZE23SCel15 TaxID=3059027 RepID=UPI00265F63A7|nr:hypothetical protein [Asticcacaulis sp. ZE23SCel15]WKL57846.1 hypothetical protein Q1W73_02365 [Asticcacaulis sp. ZE23SCel15]
MVDFLAGLIVALAYLGTLASFGLDLSVAIVDDKGKRTVGALMTRRGTFGDMFGGVNALFSGLSVIGLAIAVAFQHFELRETKAANAKADKAGVKKDFENTFFKMLDYLSKEEDRISITFIDDKILKGLSALEIYFSQITNTHRDNNADIIIQFSGKHYREKENALFVYLNTLIAIIRFVDGFEGDKTLYNRLIRLRIKPNLAVIFAYLGLHEDRHSLKEGIEKASLLECLRNDLAIFERLSGRYSPRAFNSKHLDD